MTLTQMLNDAIERREYEGQECIYGCGQQATTMTFYVAGMYMGASSIFFEPACDGTACERDKCCDCDTLLTMTADDDNDTIIFHCTQGCEWDGMRQR